MSAARSLATMVTVGSLAVGGFVLYGSYSKNKRKKAILAERNGKGGESKKKFSYFPHPPLDVQDSGSAEGSTVDFSDGDIVVLEDDGEQKAAPTRGEVLLVSKSLNVSEAIARKLLVEPLPEGWKACKLVEIEHTEDELLTHGNNIHSIFFFNFETGQSTWDNPIISKFKSDQTAAEQERAKIVAREKLEAKERNAQVVNKKRERMARRLSALNKKPMPIEKVFGTEDDIQISAKLIMDSFDKNKDGVLSKREFTNGLRGVDPKSKTGKKLIEVFGVNWRAKSAVMQVFNEIDENHDGVLSMNELVHYIDRLDETNDAQKAILCRRMSTLEDISKEKELFDRYANDKGKLDIDNFEKLWKEMGSELSGKTFSDKQCTKWATKTMKKLSHLEHFDAEEGVDFEDFKVLTASGPLFEIVSKRLAH